MRSIETIAIVSADRRIVIPLPFDIRPGAHRVVVVIDENPADVQPGPQGVRLTPQVAATAGRPLTAGIHPVGVRVAANTFRREDLYDDVKY